MAPDNPAAAGRNVRVSQDDVLVRLPAGGARVAVDIGAAEVPDRDLVDARVRFLNQLAIAGDEPARRIGQDDRYGAVTQSRGELGVARTPVRKADIESDH